MRYKFLVLTVKKLLKSVHNYGSYRKIKTEVSLFWTTRYITCCTEGQHVGLYQWQGTAVVA